MANPEREWTIMVYLAGDNNLSEECVFALNEMKSVTGLDSFYLAVQFDPGDPFLPTHRYLIRNGGVTTVATLPSDITDQARFNPRTGEVHFVNESRMADEFARERLRERKRQNRMSPLARRASLGTGPDPEDGSNDDTDTASPITLYNFLSFCMHEYPAKRYLPVIAGHGAGTQRDYLLRDTSPSGYLTLNELKQVFKQLKSDRGKPIEILGLDNCLMSMGEICYELRDCVQLLVGCESYSPASGWPFREILTRLRDELPKFSPGSRRSGDKPMEVQFATAIVEEYTRYYANYWLGGLSVAQSAMDVRKVKKFKAAVDEFAEVLVAELEQEEMRESTKPSTKQSHPFRDALVLAHWDAQSFNGERFADLHDFCDCLEGRYRRGIIPAKCDEMRSAIRQVVLKSCYNGAAYQYSHGLSLYFPWAQLANSYRNLDFVRKQPAKNNESKELLGWGKFLERYVALTRREPRNIERAPELEPALMPESSFRFRRGAVGHQGGTRKTTDMKTTDMKTSDMGGASEIVSMRNPPVVFVPDECLIRAKAVLDAESRLLVPAISKTRKRTKAFRKRGRRAS